MVPAAGQRVGRTTTARKSPSRRAPRGGQAPVHRTAVGAVTLPLAMKPKVVDVPGATVPSYSAFPTFTAPLAPVRTPPQMLLIVWPFASVMVVVQPWKAVDPPLLTVTSPW